jgi:hypothetical protein
MDADRQQFSAAHGNKTSAPPDARLENHPTRSTIEVSSTVFQTVVFGAGETGE